MIRNSEKVLRLRVEIEQKGGEGILKYLEHFP